MDSYVVDAPCVKVGTSAVDSDQNNLKYGLAAYAKRRSQGLLSKVELNELTFRKSDESSSAIRYLLDPALETAGLSTQPYYLWTYLRRTILALSFLDWDGEVHRANRAKVFRIRSSPDPAPMLHAAE
jgi:hypothetical protein